MTLITFTDGKPVMRDGMIGSEQSCCCGEDCYCVVNGLRDDNYTTQEACEAGWVWYCDYCNPAVYPTGRFVISGPDDPACPHPPFGTDCLGPARYCEGAPCGTWTCPGQEFP